MPQAIYCIMLITRQIRLITIFFHKKYCGFENHCYLCSVLVY